MQIIAKFIIQDICKHVQIYLTAQEGESQSKKGMEVTRNSKVTNHRRKKIIQHILLKKKVTTACRPTGFQQCWTYSWSHDTLVDLVPTPTFPLNQCWIIYSHIPDYDNTSAESPVRLFPLQWLISMGIPLMSSTQVKNSFTCKIDMYIIRLLRLIQNPQTYSISSQSNYSSETVTSSNFQCSWPVGLICTTSFGVHYLISSLLVIPVTSVRIAYFVPLINYVMCSSPELSLW